MWSRRPAPASPRRTLGVLAVAVTVIEVALIVSMMLAGGSDKSALARDTIFSAIMIVGALVLPEVIVGIIGIETVYGRNTGRFRVLDVLTTLAFAYPESPNQAARMSFFRGELENTLVLARKNNIDPLSLLGSFAGATLASQCGEISLGLPGRGSCWRMNWVTAALP